MAQSEHEELHSMSLGDHLEELRARLILAIAGLAAALLISVFFGNYFVRLLMKPYETAVRAEGLTLNVQAITVAEPFMVYMEAVMVLAVLIASPWLFYQFWAFISAGLYKHEQKYVYTVVPFSAGLFIVGVLFFLFVIAPMTMRFFITFNLGIDYLKYSPRISDYVDLVLILALIFGLAFQMPLMIVFAERLGLVTLETLKKYRKYVLLGVFIVAAVVTPSTDMITQIALAIPLYILYEGSIFYCGLKRRNKPSTVSLPEQQKRA
jgi:sec-independent protein translocase protein TatC